MLCPQCKSEVADNQAFCQTCGAPLSVPETQAAPSEPVEAIFAAAPAPVFSPAPAEQTQPFQPEYPSAITPPMDAPAATAPASAAPTPPPSYHLQEQSGVSEPGIPISPVNVANPAEPTITATENGSLEPPADMVTQAYIPLETEPQQVLPDLNESQSFDDALVATAPMATAPIEGAALPTETIPTPQPGMQTLETPVSTFQGYPAPQTDYQQYPAQEQTNAYQDPLQIPVPPQIPEKQTAPKSKKTRNIVIGVVGGVLLVVLAVVGVLGFMEYNRSSNYEQATTLMNDGSYQAALDKFNELGDYQDSTSLAATCQKYLDYNAAVALMDNGDYEQAQQAFLKLSGFESSDEYAAECQNHLDYNEATKLFDAKDYTAALEQFKTLASENFLDSNDKVKACKYALADILLSEGKNYEAYEAFVALGNYNDAPAKASSCAVALPGNGELYHNGDFAGSSCELTVNSNNISSPYLLKLYCGDTLVSTMFIHPNSSVTISLPANTYRIKAAYGDMWFGDADLFGDDGDYYAMTFDSAGTETMVFEPNYAYTLDLRVSSGGNVGSKNEGRENF